MAKRKREEADEGNACEAAVNEGMGSYDAEPRSLVSESFLILTSEDGGTITEHTHTAALYLPAADGEDDFEGFYEPPPVRKRVATSARGAHSAYRTDAARHRGGGVRGGENAGWERHCMMHMLSSFLT